MSDWQAELADVNARLDAITFALIAVVCSRGDVDRFQRILRDGSEQLEAESRTKEGIIQIWEEALLLNERLRLDLKNREY